MESNTINHDVYCRLATKSTAGHPKQRTGEYGTTRGFNFWLRWSMSAERKYPYCAGLLS